MVDAKGWHMDREGTALRSWFSLPTEILIPTRSTTATRLSHRILVSLSALLEFEIESWDVSGAFLKVFTFQQLDVPYRKMSIETKERRFIIKPPSPATLSRDSWLDYSHRGPRFLLLVSGAT